MSDGTALETPSLRRRVTWTTVGLVAVLLLLLAVVTDTVVESRLDGQLRQRLADRATVAEALVGQVDARDLARRLEGDGVSVLLTTADGEQYAEGPLAGAALDAQPAEGANEPGAKPGPRGGPEPPSPGPTAVVQRGDRLSITRDLSDGSTVRLLADASDVRRTVAQVRLALALAAGLVLVGTAVAVPPLVARTIRPLDRMTAVAHEIGEGDRERRLRPTRPDTELGRTAAAFDAMLDEVVGAEGRALASEQRLRDFVSDAAHELRTPVTGVQAAAEHLLRDDPARADRERALLGLVREARRAGRLVDDLLTMARIDSGLALAPEPVVLRDLAAQVVDARRTTHPEVHVEVRGDEAVALVDPDRVTQVLDNLLDNAGHATGPGGRVVVTVGAAGERVEVEVSDDGPGVPEADRERIFDRLVRLPSARDTRQGSGLGLPIARGLARAHGGDLTCEAAPGGGARFRLVVPRAGSGGPDM